MTLAIIGCAIIERMRGDTRGLAKPLELTIYGLLVWYLIGGGLGWDMLAFLLLWGVGASIGWGDVIGPLINDHQRIGDGEWWQVGRLRTDLWLAAWARGGIWGACVLPVALWHTTAVVASVAATVAFPAAIWIGRHLPDREYYIDSFMWAKNRWAAHEPIRGALVAIYCLVLMAIWRAILA